MYWKLYKSTNIVSFKKEVKKKIKPYYNYTLERKYHNMRMDSEGLKGPRMNHSVGCSNIVYELDCRYN